MRRRKKATGKEKEELKKWLKDIPQKPCPFDRGYECCMIFAFALTETSWLHTDGKGYCKRFFPGLIPARCPCHQFSLDYTKRVAKELVR